MLNQNLNIIYIEFLNNFFFLQNYIISYTDNYNNVFYDVILLSKVIFYLIFLIKKKKKLKKYSNNLINV